LAEEQLRALDRLTRALGVERFYLAGGSAVAFHLGHRRSIDLDLFSREPAVDLEAVRASLVAALPEAEILAATGATLKLRVAGVLVDLVRYPYATLAPPGPGPGGFSVAGLRDLAAMKLAAIARRGIRRDFWDLHAIVTHGVDLDDALRAYREKFDRAEGDVYHVLRALTYFADADKDPVLPEGLTEEAWQGIQAFFRAAASRLIA
jgi:hypothetical protein